MINFAIVGMGHIAKKHMDAIRNADGANLVAICDTDENRLSDVPKDVQKYLDLDEMLKDLPEIDVVNICVPSGLHMKLADIVISHKKHLVVEKPMTLTTNEAQEMINLADQANVKLAVVHPNRFRPAVQQAKKMMDQGAFGKLSHANATVRWNRNQAYYDQAPWRGTREFDGGVLMNQAIHDLDLMLWLMGPVASVQAMVATRLRSIESEDIAGAIVRFESGALGIIEAATTIYPSNLEESLSIFGSTGSMKIAGKTANLIDTWDFKGVEKEEEVKIKKEIEANPFGKPGHQWIVEDMVEAIQEDRQPVVTGEDGLRPVQLINAIIKSSELGKEVAISDIK